jgi:hypothetical protein
VHGKGHVGLKNASQGNLRIGMLLFDELGAPAAPVEKERRPVRLRVSGVIIEGHRDFLSDHSRGQN